MRRRKFLEVACLGCVGGAAIITSMESCTTSQYVTGSIKNNIVQIKKSDFTVIKKDQEVQRSFVLVRFESLPFPICVYKISETEYVALYMECTHQGCELNAYQAQLVCQCHGSEFDNKGNVLEGPADAPLKQFTTQTDEQNIYIKIA